MFDECLMKQKMVFSFYTQYQDVMRKFTLAGKSRGVLSLYNKDYYICSQKARIAQKLFFLSYCVIVSWLVNSADSAEINSICGVGT